MELQNCSHGLAAFRCRLRFNLAVWGPESSAKLERCNQTRKHDRQQQQKQYMTRRNVLLVSLIAFFVPLLCLGASKQEEAARYYEDALKRYQQDDASGAAIQLKNALQREPGMLAARVLLGKAYLQTHDSGLAAQELTKAAAAGADRSEIVIPLARALQNQGKHRELLNRFTIDRLPVAQQGPAAVAAVSPIAPWAIPTRRSVSIRAQPRLIPTEFPRCSRRPTCSLRKATPEMQAR